MRQEFLRQYQAASEIALPSTYRFSVDGQITQPRLMQRHVAAMAAERRKLLLLSDMGLGKSLAAQLAVMADGAQRILVLPINSCSHQWAEDFSTHWSGVDVQVAATRSCLPIPGTGRPQVFTIPLHLLSAISDESIAALVEQFQLDAVVLDEVQFVKQRSEDESRRRQQAAKLL